MAGQDGRRMPEDQDFELEESSFHIDPLIPKDVSLFVGDHGGAKSLTAIYIGVCTAAGRDFMGFATRPGPVIYVNNEHGIEDFHERWLNKYCQGLRVPDILYPFKSFHRQFQDLTNYTQVKELLNWCSILKPVLLVVDNVGASIGGQNENFTHIIQKLFRCLEEVVKTGSAVIAIHHYGKDHTVRGSSVFERQSDRVYLFEPISRRPMKRMLEDGTAIDEEVLLDFSIANPKSRQGSVKPFCVRIEEDDSTGAARLVYRGPFEKTDLVVEVKDRIAWLYSARKDEGFTVKEIDEALGGAYDIRDIRVAVKELFTEKKLEDRLHSKKLTWFEPGAKEIPEPKGFSETLGEEISSICSRCLEQGTLYVSLKDTFVVVDRDKYPALVSLVEKFGLNGASQRISFMLKKISGVTVRHEKDGVHVSLPRNLN